MYREKFTLVHIYDGQIPEFPLAFYSPDTKKYDSYIMRSKNNPITLEDQSFSIIIPMFNCKEEEIESQCEQLFNISTNYYKRTKNNFIIVYDDYGRMGFAIL